MTSGGHLAINIRPIRRTFLYWHTTWLQSAHATWTKIFQETELPWALKFWRDAEDGVSFGKPSKASRFPTWSEPSLSTIERPLREQLKTWSTFGISVTFTEILPNVPFDKTLVSRFRETLSASNCPYLLSFSRERDAVVIGNLLLVSEEIWVAVGLAHVRFIFSKCGDHVDLLIRQLWFFFIQKLGR